MTNKEYLIAQLGFAPGPNVAEAALIDIGIDGAAEYIPGNSIPLKTAAIKVLYTLISTADTGNSITGFMIKYDRPSILKRIGILEDEVGIIAAGPTITSRRVW